MSESKRFMCIDVGYGDDWYITDNGKRLSEMEIVDLLNNLNDENEQLRQRNRKLYKCALYGKTIGDEMSEQRFSVRLRRECDGVVYSFFDGDKPINVEMIVGLLNEQQSTIQRLERRIKFLEKLADVR